MEDWELPPDLYELFLNNPAAIPPPGVTANFENPQSRSLDGNIDAAVIYNATVYSRRLSDNHSIDGNALTRGTDVIVFAYFSTIALGGLGLHIAAHGLYHQWDLLVRDTIWYIHNERIFTILHGICVAASKVAILMQYLRIFVPFKKMSFMYWGCHICIWLNIALALINTLVVIFTCRRPKLAWDPIVYVSELRPDGCIYFYEYLFSASAINLALDCIMLLLPQKVIWRLRISRKRKLGISILFAMGIFACIASAIRLYYSHRTLNHREDRLNDFTNLGLWMGPEATCGIVIVCLPAAPRFYQSLRDKFIGSSLGSSLSPESSGTASHKDYSNQNHSDPQSTLANNEKSTPSEVSEKQQGLKSFHRQWRGDDSDDETLDSSTINYSRPYRALKQDSDTIGQDSIARGVWLEESSDEVSRRETVEGSGNPDKRRISGESV